MDSTSALCKVVAKEAVPTEGFRWIRLCKYTWQDPNGQSRPWEVVERTTRTGEIDAVCIVPIIKQRGRGDHVVLISQFRPATESYCMEFPAGLVDANETTEQAALRELHEECGYVGVVTHVSPIVHVDPGMCSACMRYVTVEVDLDHPDNQNPMPNLEDSEFIEVETVPVRRLRATLEEKMRQNWSIDARLYGYALSLEAHQSTTQQWLGLLSSAVVGATVAVAGLYFLRHIR